MMKTIILLASLLFFVSGCAHHNVMKEEKVEKKHYKVKPKLSHSFYN